MTFDEMVRAVEKIHQVNGTEDEIAVTVNLLRKEFPHAKIIDLIFHDFRELTAQQVVEETLQREAQHAREVGRRETLIPE